MTAGAPPSWPLWIAAVAVAAALPLTIPYGRFIGDPARADTLALLPVWTINRHFLAGSVLLTVGLVCAALGLLVLFVPRRAAVALPLVVLGLVRAGAPPGLLRRRTGSSARRPAPSSRGSAASTARLDRRRRAERRRRRPCSGAAAAADRFVVNQNEFFNRAVGQVYYTGAPTDGGIHELHDLASAATASRAPTTAGSCSLATC